MPDRAGFAYQLDVRLEGFFRIGTRAVQLAMQQLQHGFGLRIDQFRMRQVAVCDATDVMRIDLRAFAADPAVEADVRLRDFSRLGAGGTDRQQQAA